MNGWFQPMDTSLSPKRVCGSQAIRTIQTRRASILSLMLIDTSAQGHLRRLTAVESWSARPPRLTAKANVLALRLRATGRLSLLRPGAVGRRHAAGCFGHVCCPGGARWRVRRARPFGSRSERSKCVRGEPQVTLRRQLGYEGSNRKLVPDRMMRPTPGESRWAPAI
jgi:hypothetical protein